ncbi:MAG: [FeFe] hydrogenase H-cluster radical SAM maturase HydE [Proteobacteria bacterium]|nr:[FeFe] hydrogenase H-cluster radical SAM maturase HydE [Pseudomonadota bacterium]
MNVASTIRKIMGSGRPDGDILASLLSLTDPSDEERLFKAACEVKRERLGPVAHLRGLVEFSNVCARNCLYCGIRRDHAIRRYAMSAEEILSCARFALENRYGSLVLQSGERDDPEFVEFVDDIVREIKRQGDGALGITLSCGEQSEETYRRWFESGAHRYLLRIETSDPELYARLHPADQGFERRVQCLRSLRAAGYQVGTGVMIGLPRQTAEHLANDILFFSQMDIDMIGMGPYVLHDETPLAAEAVNTPGERRRRLSLALRMIALARIVMPDLNIAASTALQALDTGGRELGLLAGANVVMPNITPREYRGDYLLYEGKPCVGEDADMCRGCLERRINSIGEKVGWDEWGDSRHFFKRKDISS